MPQRQLVQRGVTGDRKPLGSGWPFHWRDRQQGSAIPRRM
jgi:hypothetical protein